MKASDWLRETTQTLETAGIASARLDALILLEDATGKDRAWLLAHPDHELDALGSDPRHNKMLEMQVNRRAAHEPLAYIRGKSEFFGHTFKVSPATLQPRPETETMIELLLKLQAERPAKTIVDIGTGSGCIAIATKLALPKTNVYATEINDDALKIAKHNAQELAADVEFYRGDLLDPIGTQISYMESLVIVTNLPYVPDSHTINEAAHHEPRQAIFGGADGLDLYRQLFEQLNTYNLKPIHILTEALPPQHASLASIAAASGYTETLAQDLIQLFSRY